MSHVAKDAAGMFVYKVDKWLFALYQDMQGPRAVDVNETDFGRKIRACHSVTYFHWEKTRHMWVNRDVDDEAALEIIKTQVRDRLAKAATMEERKGHYSAKIQSEFDRI
jgi:hypothetical protein